MDIIPITMYINIFFAVQFNTQLKIITQHTNRYISINLIHHTYLQERAKRAHLRKLKIVQCLMYIINYIRIAIYYIH